MFTEEYEFGSPTTSGLGANRTNSFKRTSTMVMDTDSTPPADPLRRTLSRPSMQHDAQAVQDIELDDGGDGHGPLGGAQHAFFAEQDDLPPQRNQLNQNNNSNNYSNNASSNQMSRHSSRMSIHTESSRGHSNSNSDYTPDHQQPPHHHGGGGGGVEMEDVQMSQGGDGQSQSSSRGGTPRGIVSPRMANGASAMMARIPSFARSEAASPHLARRRSTFRQTSLPTLPQADGTNSNSQQNLHGFLSTNTPAASTSRPPMHRPLMSRDFPQPAVPAVGILRGFYNYFLCNNSINTPKEPGTDTIDEATHVLLLTEEEREKYNAVYTEDEVTNTIVLAPAPLVFVLLAIVLYCDIIVFWATNTRLYETGALPWSGGEVSVVEGILPLVMAALYLAAVTYANTLDVSFTFFERQFLIEPEVLQSLHGREMYVGIDGLQVLCDPHSIGQTAGRQSAVRRSIARKVRWYSQEGMSAIPADLYANYINSLASTGTAREYRRLFWASSATILAPLFVAAAPISARVFNGGSVWGEGLAEEFGLVICGFFLTFVCCYSVVSMLNLYSQTLKFHFNRMDWLSRALPDPTRPVEDTWPTCPFDSLDNILVWHRLRSVVLRPPMTLYTWGRRLSEVTYLLFVFFITMSIVYNLIRKEPSAYDASTALTIALLVTFAPLLLELYYTPLKFTFLTENTHPEVLSRILLLSLKSFSLNRSSGQAYETMSKLQELRSAIRVIMSSITTEEFPLSFLGLPIGPTTIVVIGGTFLAAAGLVVMRGVYMGQQFI